MDAEQTNNVKNLFIVELPALRMSAPASQGLRSWNDRYIMGNGPHTTQMLVDQMRLMTPSPRNAKKRSVRWLVA